MIKYGELLEGWDMNGVFLEFCAGFLLYFSETKAFSLIVAWRLG